MSIVVEEFLSYIFSCSHVRKYVFRQSRVTNFQIFLLGAHHSGLNVAHLNISSPDFYLRSFGTSACPITMEENNS